MKHVRVWIAGEIEIVTEGGNTFDEAQVTQRGKKSEVKVDASGQPIK